MHGHTFVITHVPSLRTWGTTPVNRGGRTFLDTEVVYGIAQGGQCLTAQFPDDGSCMATNESTWTLNTSNWMCGQRKVRYWIDISAVARLCVDRKKQKRPLIVPDRRRWW
jgi:hypothetical protein